MYHKLENPISMGILYHDVFGGIQSYSNPNTSDSKRTKTIERIQTVFSSITNDTKLSTSFRSTIRELQATNLEDILYGDHSAILPASSKEYSFPSNEDIQKKFEELNAYYQFFLDLESDDPRLNQFNIMFKGTKLIADYFECNNDDDNSVAYLHAYKIAVLFDFSLKKNKTFKGIQDYIHKFSKTAHPIHDALVQPLPINQPALQDMQGWRTFIHTYGDKGIEVFQRAPQIEELLNKAPATLSQARKAVETLVYSRYKENPRLATLCMRFNLSEEIFNRCLEIDKRRKTKDNLPLVSIDGAEVGYPGYYFVKLPIDDPIAYILGYITKCCQSVGGASEQCVIDGMTRENNGFYVLLKGKPSKEPFINGKINYSFWNIVGQGYAWLSEEANLTLDSWENLRPEDNKIIVPILQLFGKKVTDSCPEIMRVTIGKGGKTPVEFQKTLIDEPEKIAEGSQYIDSKNQCLLYFAEDKLQKLKAQFVEQWHALLKKPLGMDLDDLCQFLKIDKIYSILQMRQIEKLFLQDYSHDLWQRLITDKKIIVQLQKKMAFNSQGLLKIMAVLHQENLLNDSFFSLLLPHLGGLGGRHLEMARLIARVIEKLQQAKILNEENFKLVVACPKQAGLISEGLAILLEAGLLTNENFQDFLIHSKFSNFYDGYRKKCNYFMISLQILNQVPELLTNENFRLLAHSRSPDTMARGLRILHKNQLLNTENTKVIAARPYSAENNAGKIVKLHKNGHLTNENRNELLNNTKVYSYKEGHKILEKAGILTADNCHLFENCPYPDHLNYIAKGLVTLENAGLLSEETRNVAKKYSYEFDKVAEVFVLLKKAGILTENNQNKVIERGRKLDGLIPLLREFQKENFLTEAVFKVLLTYPKQATDFASCLKTLKTADLLADENYQPLIHAVKGNFFNWYLDDLQKANLLTNENYKILITHPKKAHFIKEALITLHEAGILNEGTKEVILIHPDQAFEYSGDLVALKTRLEDTLENATSFGLSENLSHPNYFAFFCSKNNSRDQRLELAIATKILDHLHGKPMELNIEEKEILNSGSIGKIVLQHEKSLLLDSLAKHVLLDQVAFSLEYI